MVIIIRSYSVHSFSEEGSRSDSEHKMDEVKLHFYRRHYWARAELC